jgi:hypothetical protein
MQLEGNSARDSRPAWPMRSPASRRRRPVHTDAHPRCDRSIGATLRAEMSITGGSFHHTRNFSLPLGRPRRGTLRAPVRCGCGSNRRHILGSVVQPVRTHNFTTASHLTNNLWSYFPRVTTHAARFSIIIWRCGRRRRSARAVCGECLRVSLRPQPVQELRHRSMSVKRKVTVPQGRSRRFVIVAWPRPALCAGTGCARLLAPAQVSG